VWTQWELEERLSQKLGIGSSEKPIRPSVAAEAGPSKQLQGLKALAHVR
jgi:hypothetical protein